MDIADSDQSAGSSSASYAHAGEGFGNNRSRQNCCIVPCADKAACSASAIICGYNVVYIRVVVQVINAALCYGCALTRKADKCTCIRDTIGADGIGVEKEQVKESDLSGGFTQYARCAFVRSKLQVGDDVVATVELADGTIINREI